MTPGITAKNEVLLLASLAFYAWGEPRFVILLLAQTALNWRKQREKDWEDVKTSAQCCKGDLRRRRVSPRWPKGQ